MYGAETGVWVQDGDVWGRDWCVGSGWRCMGQRLVCGFRMERLGQVLGAWVPGPVKIRSHLPQCQHLFVALSTKIRLIPYVDIRLVPVIEI